MSIPLYKPSDQKRLLEISENRDSYRRDNGRLIHSSVFRRLQGKTQLFPSYESDFFRNRLTHSLEVAQIAKGIAEIINVKNPYFQEHPINIDLVETAGLAHDLGHPPFGHNGEKALDDCMKAYGGFEGNAQTLRILTKIEKKNTFGEGFRPLREDKTDNRCGLNLTYRTLAAVIKYDQEIPLKRPPKGKKVKGYYYTEKDVVNAVRLHVLGSNIDDELKTIECQIMDIADDIAYSTYDLEDAFKAEFLSPMKMLATEPELLSRVGRKVKKRLSLSRFGKKDVFKVLFENYKEVFIEDVIEFASDKNINSLDDLIPFLATYAFDFSNRLCCDGYFRTKHTSKLVHEFMCGVSLDLNAEIPAISKVFLNHDIGKRVEVLKNYTYEAVIMSPRLKVTEYRGYEIVCEIFKALTTSLGKFKGYKLLPDDFQMLYEGFSDKALKNRVVCDFIAGMTDRYAVEFYARLKSENPQTIFKPF